MRKIWLKRLTLILSSAFILMFIFIILRGLTWSQSRIEDHISAIGIGTTEVIHYHGKKVWATRFSQNQLANLSVTDDYVFQQGGCYITEKSLIDYCLVITQTQQQGVVIRYIKEKPNNLSADIPWNGGYINPVNGAVYHLLGRLYKQVASEQVDTAISIQLVN